MNGPGALMVVVISPNSLRRVAPFWVVSVDQLPTSPALLTPRVGVAMRYCRFDPFRLI